MTTVAVDADGNVAADTQLTSLNYVVRAQKLFRLPDGGVASGCGEWSRAYAGLQWLADGESGEPPSIRGAELVIVRPDRSIWLVENEFPAYPILDKTVAVGCGRDLARSALARGMSAVDAVRDAIGLDLMSSEPIQCMRVVQPAEFPGVVTCEPPKQPKAKIRGKAAK